MGVARERTPSTGLVPGRPAPASLRTLSFTLLFLGATGAPFPADAQTVVTRTPNLSGGWVGGPGTLHFHLVHRFWTVGAGDEEKLVNSPTMFVGVPLPMGFLVGANYASNSLVASSRFNEWESLVRWAPFAHPPGGVEASGSVAYNWAAESLDLEAGLAWDVPLSGASGSVSGGSAGVATVGSGSSGAAWAGAGTARTGPALRLLVSARRFGNALGGETAANGLGGGAVLRLRQGLSLAGDVGRLAGGGAGRSTVWGAGVQMQIPTTPHSISLQASNTRTGTLHGSMVSGRTVWGFEFTVPVTPGRYLPRRDAGDGPHPPAHHVEVAMTHDLRFVPDTLRIQAGQTVLWRNSTTVIHTVTLEAADSGDLRPGESFWHTFTTPGTYAYTCVPHDMAGMRGVVVVVP